MFHRQINAKTVLGYLKLIGLFRMSVKLVRPKEFSLQQTRIPGRIYTIYKRIFKNA